MATISRSGISTAQPIQATHITNIIDALDGTSTTVTVVATGSFSGSFRGNLVGTASVATLATKASTLAIGGGNGVAMTFNPTAFGGQPTYVWGTSDAGLTMDQYNPLNFTVNSASYAVSSSRTTSASFATTAGSATTAATASTVLFSGITSLPASLTGYSNGGGGVATVGTTITENVGSTSNLTNGTFYPANASTVPITINLDVNLAGFEFTVFATNVANDIQFAAGSGATIISPNGYLKLNGTGSAAVAKAIASDTWALIGNLKA
jgi:hypothetical protein